MADTITITGLPDASMPLTGDEFAVLDQGPNTVRVKLRNLPSGAPVFSGAKTDFVTLTAPNAGFASATFSSMVFDRGGFFDPLDPTHLTAPQDGFYRAGMETTWDTTGADTTGFIEGFIQSDSATSVGSFLLPLSANPNDINMPLVTPPFPLTAGQQLTYNVAVGGNPLSVEVIGWIELIGSASFTPTSNRVLWDTFTDADGTSLTAHVMNSGPGWTIIAGGWTIQSNSAQDTAVAGGENLVFSDCGSGSSTVSAICTPTTLYDFGLLFNLADGSNYWLASPEVSTNLLRLYSRIGGTYTLEDSTPLTLTPGTPILLEVISAGDAVTVRVDGTDTISFSVGGRALQTETLCGLRISGSEISSGTTFDDFQAFV